MELKIAVQENPDADMLMMWIMSNHEWCVY